MARRRFHARRAATMTEPYSHGDVGEKKAAVEGKLKLVTGGKAGDATDTGEHKQNGSRRALN